MGPSLNVAQIQGSASFFLFIIWLGPVRCKVITLRTESHYWAAQTLPELFGTQLLVWETQPPGNGMFISKPM